MIFSNILIAFAALYIDSAQAQDPIPPPIQIAGYYADSTAKDYLYRDQVQIDFENVMDDNDGNDKSTCTALALGKEFWDSSDPDKGAYLRSIPTYTGSESDEWGEYTSYYGSSNFHISWVNQAFQQGLNPDTNAGPAPTGFGNGKADFYAAFINKSTTPNTQGVWYRSCYPSDCSGVQAEDCIGFVESIKKTTSHVYQFGEIMQLLQEANDSITPTQTPTPLERPGRNPDCYKLPVSERGLCYQRLRQYDAAVLGFVGSGAVVDPCENCPNPHNEACQWCPGLGYSLNPNGEGYGVTLWSLAERECVHFGSCGINYDSDSQIDTSPVNHEIMRLFAAGRQAAYNFEKDQMKVIQRLISNKLAIGAIQGTMRYAWRLSGQGGTPNTLALTPGVDTPGFFAYVAPDKEVGAMGSFAMVALPKVWACSRNAEAKLYAEVKIGGAKTVTPDPNDNSFRPTINFDNVKLAFECNYKCLGITCKEVGSLFDGQTTLADGNGIQYGTPLARSVTCNDGKMGTTANNPTCKKIRGNPEKKRCKPFVKRPGIAGRDELKFFHNAVVV